MTVLDQTNACITVAIVSANQLVGLGLQSVFHAWPHIQFIGAAASAIEAEQVVSRYHPQVLLIEWGSGCGTLQLVQTLKATAPETRLIALIRVDGAMHIQDALSAGIRSFVLTIQPPEVMVATIEHAVRGTMTMTRAESSRMGQGDPGPGSGEMGQTAFTSEAPLDELTTRECEVMALVGEGLSNKAIADRLRISSTTVRHHLTSIFDKVGVSTRQKLLVLAYRRGLVAPGVPAESSYTEL